MSMSDMLNILLIILIILIGVIIHMTFRLIEYRITIKSLDETIKHKDDIREIQSKYILNLKKEIDMKDMVIRSKDNEIQSLKVIDIDEVKK